MGTESGRSVASQRLQGTRVAFLGKLGGVNRKDAQRLVRQHGGVSVAIDDATVNLVVIGADELPLEDDHLLDDRLRAAAAQGTLEIISETEFWRRLGMLEDTAQSPVLYTPAQLADLLGVAVSAIRRWRRRGLLRPVREVHKLPYFDFQEATTARRIARLLVDGRSPQAIEAQLERLARHLPDADRPLAQLAILVEGRQLLLRLDAGLIEPGGQLRIDFESMEDAEHETQQAEAPSTVAMPAPCSEMTVDDLCALAAHYDEQGRLDAAVEAYRAALGGGGPDAEVCFQLAEALYRLGDLAAARERYFMAIELEPSYVEARANLGCVLAEMGDLELAVAALQGALTFHPEYADVHYHLARTLDEMDQPGLAAPHWEAFLQLAPASPWAQEARDRLVR